MRRFVTCTAGALLLVLGATRASESGIEGEAVIGPTRPSHRIGDATPDTAPYETTLVVLKASDATEVARVKTGTDGRFRLLLPPGEYVIRVPLDSRIRVPRAEPKRVRVSSGKIARVTLSFDNGLR